MKIALVLLAAGQSLRFGGDKLRHPIGGEPMLTRMLRLYGALPFDSRTVVLNESRRDFAETAQALGFEPVYNPRPEDGQSQSVRLGVIHAMARRPDGILCSVADQPNLQADTVLRLLTAFEAQPDRIVQTVSNGRRGNPVLFPAVFADALCALTGDVGGNAVIRRHADLLLPVEAEERELRDMDRRTEEFP